MYTYTRTEPENFLKYVLQCGIEGVQFSEPVGGIFFGSLYKFDLYPFVGDVVKLCGWHCL